VAALYSLSAGPSLRTKSSMAGGEFESEEAKPVEGVG
jgi:hypothetical protein